MIKSIIKTIRPFVKITFWMLFVTYTIAPLYEKFLGLALPYKQPDDTASWMLGDIATIFTVMVYIAMYAIVETCVAAFGVDADDKKAKTQDQAQDKTSDKSVSEA